MAFGCEREAEAEARGGRATTCLVVYTIISIIYYMSFKLKIKA